MEEEEGDSGKVSVVGEKVGEELGNDLEDYGEGRGEVGDC